MRARIARFRQKRTAHTLNSDNRARGRNDQQLRCVRAPQASIREASCPIPCAAHNLGRHGLLFVYSG